MKREDIYQLIKICLGVVIGTYVIIRSTQIYNLLKFCLK